MFRTLAACFFLLVPKLRLGTHCIEALLRCVQPRSSASQAVGSQAELGNQGVPHRLQLYRAAFLSTFFFTSALTVSAAEPLAADVDFFEKRIRPVLVEKCYSCHSVGAKKIESKLLLDTRDGIRKGGENGPAIVPGKPDESLLNKAIRYEKREMPPKGKLPASVIADFEAWIKAGAVDPRDALASSGKTIDIAKAKHFWSFQRPKRYEPPETRDLKWARNAIDAFILAKLEAAVLQPAPAADPRTLIRRLYFDLIGLPPSVEDVDEFVRDYGAKPQAAFEKVVDKLLASPQYGERWARAWLDVARYAEDQAHIVGSNVSLTYPNAYLYRDWVIKSFNDDMPYDRFVKLQLAADLIAEKEPAHLPALGFIGLGAKYYDRGKLTVMADEWEDRVDIVGRGLLGLTVACARCHDHKFDPIPTADYYGLAGIFASTSMFNKPMDAKVEKNGENAKSPKDAMHIIKDNTPTDLNVFIRGVVENKGPIAIRHFLSVLCNGEPKAFDKGSGRQELAEAIADPKNPLTARVIVNRVWAVHFGKGLVGTTSNFGALGDRPSHPELLDDLAVRFMEHGWSLKWLHKEMILSATYRQSSQIDAKKTIADAENKLLSRMPRSRLTVEMWRDSILSATGKLDHSVGGKSIDPLDPKQTRRTIYSSVSRLELNRLLALFDFPDPNIHASRRAETTTPLQRLFVLNSPFMVEQASNFFDRLQMETSEDDRKRIERAYLLLYARPASDQEIEIGLKFLMKDGDKIANWKQYAHALLAANEMMFLD